ncbi:hypothetical protein DFH09DRAFT_1309547 [Mycena vulgaris]|nr:hypothetical protein DFH09DRAFT_1309547 [Mycena vulgaris]
MDPSYEDHENPALATIFEDFLPRVVEILAAFDNTQPDLASFNKYLAGKPSLEQSGGVSDGMHSLGLVPTPELEPVLTPSLQFSFTRPSSGHKELERNRRVMGVDSALPQLLAVQEQLGEPLDLTY